MWLVPKGARHNNLQESRWVVFPSWYVQVGGRSQKLIIPVYGHLKLASLCHVLGVLWFSNRCSKLKNLHQGGYGDSLSLVIIFTRFVINCGCYVVCKIFTPPWLNALVMIFTSSHIHKSWESCGFSLEGGAIYAHFKDYSNPSFWTVGASGFQHNTQLPWTLCYKSTWQRGKLSSEFTFNCS